MFDLCLASSVCHHQDQFDNLDKHTQWGIDFLERYAKFVKERLEVEQNYAKQLRYTHACTNTEHHCSWLTDLHCFCFCITLLQTQEIHGCGGVSELTLFASVTPGD